MMYTHFSRDYWLKLVDQNNLDREIFHQNEAANVPRDEMIKLIEDVIVDITHQLSVSSTPCLRFKCRRSWENVEYVENVGIQMIDDAVFTTISFANECSTEKFGLMMKVLSIIYKLLQQQQIATKRDIYYEEPHLFRKQSIVDGIVDDIACMLEVPRRCLNVVATSKGIVAGDLLFQENDSEIVDCSQSQAGVSVPVLIESMSAISSRGAKFMLVVEKAATFQRLLDDRLTDQLPCILITGKGVPDVNVRLLIRKIWNALQIPVFGLMDADPHGIEIMMVYRFGSLSQAYDSKNLALPFMKWIGIFPSDITRLRLPEDVLIPLSTKDRAKCREMLCRPYIDYHPRLQQEIDRMIEGNFKAEIQSLTRISSTYLSQVHIPTQIKHGGWI